MRAGIPTTLAFCVLYSMPALGANPFGALTPPPSAPEPTVEPTREPDPEKPPLQRWPVETYILMGLLASGIKAQNQQIAILRTPAPHSQTYLMRYGDLLGDRDGYVTAFDDSGITVVQRAENGSPEHIRIIVRNRGVRDLND